MPFAQSPLVPSVSFCFESAKQHISALGKHLVQSPGKKKPSVTLATRGNVMVPEPRPVSSAEGLLQHPQQRGLLHGQLSARVVEHLLGSQEGSPGWASGQEPLLCKHWSRLAPYCCTEGLKAVEGKPI